MRRERKKEGRRGERGRERKGRRNVNVCYGCLLSCRIGRGMPGDRVTVWRAFSPSSSSSGSSLGGTYTTLISSCRHIMHLALYSCLLVLFLSATIVHGSLATTVGSTIAVKTAAILCHTSLVSSHSSLSTLSPS